jgi:hypothetical protein
MKRRRFGQNAPFHLKGKGGKTCQSTNQSSICDLFNRVLNYNFDLKSMQLYPCQKSNSGPIVSRLFHFGPWS